MYDYNVTIITCVIFSFLVLFRAFGLLYVSGYHVQSQGALMTMKSVGGRGGQLMEEMTRGIFVEFHYAPMSEFLDFGMV